MRYTNEQNSCTVPYLEIQACTILPTFYGLLFFEILMKARNSCGGELVICW